VRKTNISPHHHYFISGRFLLQLTTVRFFYATDHSISYIQQLKNQQHSYTNIEPQLLLRKLIQQMTSPNWGVLFALASSIKTQRLYNQHLWLLCIINAYGGVVTIWLTHAYTQKHVPCNHIHCVTVMRIDCMHHDYCCCSTNLHCICINNC